MSENINDTKIETDEDETVEDAHTKGAQIYIKWDNSCFWDFQI